MRGLVRGLLLAGTILVVGAAERPREVPPGQAAVDRAARRFRLEVYRTLHGNRREFDRRIERGAQLLAQWQERGALEADAPLVAAWFHEAARHTTAGWPSALPPLPEWPPVAPGPSRPPEGSSSTEITVDEGPPAPGLEPRRTRGKLGLQGPRQTDDPTRPLAARALPRPSPAPRAADISAADRELAATVRRETEPHVTPAPALRIDGPSAADEPPGPRIDLAQLAARIGGYNLGLRAIEIQLNEPGTWSVERLEPLCAEFRALEARRELSDMYLQVLQPGERKQVAEHEASDAVLTMLGQRTFEARARALARDFPGDAEQRRRELSRLDELARQLQGRDPRP